MHDQCEFMCEFIARRIVHVFASHREVFNSGALGLFNGPSPLLQPLLVRCSAPPAGGATGLWLSSIFTPSQPVMRHHLCRCSADVVQPGEASVEPAGVCASFDAHGSYRGTKGIGKKPAALAVASIIGPRNPAHI